MPSRRMLAAALVCILAGCGDDPAGPGPFLLLGRFGNPESHAELLAIRAGAELNLPCGAYFTSADPILLSGDLTFSTAGLWQDAFFGGPVEPERATLTGELAGERLEVTMQVDEPGGTMLSFTLDRGASGELDDVACAL